MPVTSAIPATQQPLTFALAGGSSATLSSSSVDLSSYFTVSGGSGDGAVTYTAAPSTVCTVSGSTLTTLSVGTCTVIATRLAGSAGGVSYSAIISTPLNLTVPPGSTAQAALSVSRVAESATTLANNLKNFTLSDYVSVSGGSGSGAVSYTASPSNVCTVSGNTLTTLAAGPCNVGASKAATASYTGATTASTITLTVPTPASGQAPVLVTRITGATAQLGSNSNISTLVTVSTGTGTGTVTYQSTTPSICTVSGTTLTPVAAGDCTIVTTKAGSGEMTAEQGNAVSIRVGGAYIISGRLTWAPITSGGSWDDAKSTCNTLTALGYAASTWRQPTESELRALYLTGKLTPIPAGWLVNGTWAVEQGYYGNNGGLGYHRFYHLNDGSAWYGHNAGPRNVSCVHAN